MAHLFKPSHERKAYSETLFLNCLHTRRLELNAYHTDFQKPNQSKSSCHASSLNPKTIMGSSHEPVVQGHVDLFDLSPRGGPTARVSRNVVLKQSGGGGDMQYQ